MSILSDLYNRVHARIQMRGGDAYERLVAERKRRLFADLSGDVLEIGVGAGPNLRFLPPGTRYVGVEPNPHVHRHLIEEARKLGITADIRGGAAEALDVPDASMDVVIGTCVLCSVRDPALALAEIRRVLRPGGKYYFLEHVAAPRGTWLRRVQRFVQPVWTPLGGGCHPDRETYATIEASGFGGVHIEHFRLPIWPMGPHIDGVAIR
jgi:SAM-dependent methyltransferase